MTWIRRYLAIVPTKRRYAIIAAALAVWLVPIQSAKCAPQTEGGDNTAQQLSNPISSLISVPFENNFAFGKRGSDGLIWQQNIQPVIPVKLNDDLNLIARTIIPISSANHAEGLGDIVQSLFLSPSPKGGFTFGGGPVLVVPTETDKRLGLGQVGLGPTAVAVEIHGPALFGLLLNHVWNVNRVPNGRERLNASVIEPFASFTLPSKTSFIFVSESTYDSTSHRWTIPLTFTANQLIKVGNQLIQVGLGPTYYAKRLQEPSSRWGAQFTLTLVYPTKP